MHLCGYAFPSTRADPPRPLQRLGERRAAEARRLPPRDELADGEVRLLLAGARPQKATPRISTAARRGQGLTVSLRTWHRGGIVAPVKRAPSL
jgi:hypothetical protein